MEFALTLEDPDSLVAVKVMSVHLQKSRYRVTGDLTSDPSARRGRHHNNLPTLKLLPILFRGNITRGLYKTTKLSLDLSNLKIPLLLNTSQLSSPHWDWLKKRKQSTLSKSYLRRNLPIQTRTLKSKLTEIEVSDNRWPGRSTKRLTKSIPSQPSNLRTSRHPSSAEHY